MASGISSDNTTVSVETSTYWKQTFSDGTILKTVGSNGKSHRLFNFTQQAFIYPQDWLKNDCCFKQDTTTPYSTSLEPINEEVYYYNIITDYHVNLFANGILTSCRYSNIYPIKNMAYVKDNRDLKPFTAYNVSEKYYKGLRLSEQPIDIEKTNKYVKHLEDAKIWYFT